MKNPNDGLRGPDNILMKIYAKPSYVTGLVFFLTLSHPDGHASRAFYMQKVNDDGLATNNDLNGNGTAEYNFSIQNTATSYYRKRAAGREAVSFNGCRLGRRR